MLSLIYSSQDLYKFAYIIIKFTGEKQIKQHGNIQSKLVIITMIQDNMFLTSKMLKIIDSIEIYVKEISNS